MKETFYQAAVLATALAFGALGIGIATAKLGLNPLFTSEANAVKLLKKNNFEPVKVGGYGWLKCGAGPTGDLWRTNFTAQNQKGEIVTGTVCEGAITHAKLRF